MHNSTHVHLERIYDKSSNIDFIARRNTSFNRHHIPTISDPRQALEHLLDGCMDYLAISDYLVSFDGNSPQSQLDIFCYEII